MTSSFVGQDPRPVSVHAEQVILGAILVEPMAIYEAIDLIVSTDFALDSHRHIYSAILELHEEGRDVDIVTVANVLRSHKSLDSIGGVPYLASLSEGLPRRLSIQSYVRIVRDKSLARQGLDMCQHAENEFCDQSIEALETLTNLQARILDLSSGKSANSEGVSSIGGRVISKIEEERKIQNTETAFGYTYGIEGIDRRTRGAYSGEYTVILGETNSGKTAWMTQIILDNALRGVPCHLFSMEMTREQIYRRMMSPLSKVVTASHIRDPRLMFREAFEDAKDASALLSSLPITIDDTSSLPLDHLIARAKAAVHRDGVKMIFIDYLQLIQAATGKRNDNENMVITAATLGLRDLSRDLDEKGVHVVALSQYARSQETGRARASNSRARGSGAIEQSCQCMMHIVRDELEDGALANQGEIKIGKQREGMRGIVRFSLDPDHLRFTGI